MLQFSTYIGENKKSRPEMDAALNFFLKTDCFKPFLFHEGFTMTLALMLAKPTSPNMFYGKSKRISKIAEFKAYFGEAEKAFGL
jgi:hypothetical protein